MLLHYRVKYNCIGLVVLLRQGNENRKMQRNECTTLLSVSGVSIIYCYVATLPWEIYPVLLRTISEHCSAPHYLESMLCLHFTVLFAILCGSGVVAGGGAKHLPLFKIFSLSENVAAITTKF